MQKWRNWQTRRLQVPVVAIQCGFKSHLLHEQKDQLERVGLFLFVPRSPLNPGFKVSSDWRPASVGSTGKRSTGPFSFSVSPHLLHESIFDFPWQCQKTKVDISSFRVHNTGMKRRLWWLTVARLSTVLHDDVRDGFDVRFRQIDNFLNRFKKLPIRQYFFTLFSVILRRIPCLEMSQLIN